LDKIKLMEEKLYIQSIDEFNYTSCVNFFEKNQEFSNSVLCFSGFEIMFYNFKKIIVSKMLKTKGVLLSSDINLKSYIFDELKKEALQYQNSYLSQSDLKTDFHIYKFMFYNLAKDLEEGSKELYRPKINDYFYIQEKLKNIDKKIVTINGRNLYGNRSGLNCNFIDLIKYLLDNNIFIINCTMPNPKLSSFFKSDSYMEIDKEELYDYSKNISYFLNSNCLISVANSAGITNHICTKSNIILVGNGGWVDNPEFGFNNKSLFEISSNIKPTYAINNFEHILKIIKELEKPKDLLFFDESKIIY